MKCAHCKKQCDELFECDCAEYSEVCEKCLEKVPTHHREEVCFLDWCDYNYVDETRPEAGYF